MKNTKRSAFTIVELVIVIAVIAILSAVLIPTFGGIIESANKAVDTQLVAQINTILAVEDILGGGVNDAVEIQKVVKENGLKLQTKSKGQYIWYDIENKRVVLGGLDENGIVLDSEEPTAAVDANGPALISDTNVVTEIRKGQFNEDTTAPENFIKGYLFLSTESADNLAEIIYALRNPEGTTPDEVKASLNETLGKIENTALKSNLTAMLSTTAVMAKNGATGFIGDSNTSVTRVIVSSEMTNISADTISDVLAYPNVVAVDFHSGVVTADDDAIAALNGRTEKPYFIYSNDELKKVDIDNGNIAFLIHKDERGEYIKSVYVINVIDGKEDTSKKITEFLEYEFSYNLNYEYRPGTASESYDFVGYSFYNDGSNPLALGEHTYKLSSTEQLLIDANGNLTIYLVYERAASDFKIGNDYYSSKTMTYMLANGAVTSGTITVVSTDAVLDASLIGLANATLNIKSGVTLWVPCSVTNYSGRNNSGAYYPQYDNTTKPTYGTFDKDNDNGVYKLTIANNVTLTNNGYITVDAVLYQQGDSAHFGFISNNSGVLVVNGKIINNSGSRMEAYGVVRTEANGSVDAESGSTVTEIMSVLDLHGGQTTLAATVNNLSPFNNYTVDSIRLPLTVKFGATYTTYGVIEAEGVHSLDFKIAGSSGTPDEALSTNPLFLMHSGSEIVKSYDKDNGIHVTIHGEVEDCIKMFDIDIKAILTQYLKNNMSLPDWAAGLLGTAVGAFVDFDGISFAVIPMPIPNFDLTVADGATLSLSRATYKLLPGSDWVVEEGGTLNLNCTMVVYDSFVLDGGGKTVVTPRIYNETNGNAFTKANATLTVKGTLDLKSNAKLAGTITGGANKAEIKVASTNSLSCPEIKEGGNGKIGIDIGFFKIDITGEIDQYTVKDFVWNAKCVQSGSALPKQITEAGTYKFDGSIWAK